MLGMDPFYVANEGRVVVVVPGDQAEAALELQQKELDRYTNLVATQSASQQELDRVESAYRAARARVAERATATAQLDKLTPSDKGWVTPLKVSWASSKLLGNLNRLTHESIVLR